MPLLLLSGRPPRPQTGRGALQELPQRAIVAPLCRAALTADRAREVLPTTSCPPDQALTKWQQAEEQRGQ
ncbi:MAG TPA: hypothetical protein VGD91_02050 [Trebonia sp.]